MITNATEALEDWLNSKKGRYVQQINHDTGYGASCWTVTIGNSDVQAGKEWFIQDGWAKKYNKAEVYTHEVSFFEIDERDTYPNVVFADEEDFVGLGPTILAAIKRAEELGL